MLDSVQKIHKGKQAKKEKKAKSNKENLYRKKKMEVVYQNLGNFKSSLCERLRFKKSQHLSIETY